MLVIGTSRRPYDIYDARAVRVLLDFAASGKSLIFAGPDVMPREFYSAPDNTQASAADIRLTAGRASDEISSEAVLPDGEGRSISLQTLRGGRRQLLLASQPVFNASTIPVSAQCYQMNDGVSLCRDRVQWVRVRA